MSKKANRKTRRKRGVSRVTSIDTPQSHTHAPISRQSRSMRVAAQYYSGPIMSPEMAGQWEAVVPGSANRFIKIHENQADHRQTLERQVVGSNIESEKRGQIFAFIVFMTALIGGFILVALGIQVTGIVSIIGSMGAIVGLFIYERTQGKKQLEKKREKVERNEPTIAAQHTDNQLKEKESSIDSQDV